MTTNPFWALIVVENPAESDRTNDQRKNWPDVLECLNTLSKRDANSVRIAENVLLWPLSNGIRHAGKFVDAANRNGFSCRITFLDEDHKWYLSAAD